MAASTGPWRPTTVSHGGSPATRRDPGDCCNETTSICIFVGGLVLFMLLVVWIGTHQTELRKTPEYSVAITGVSGLPTSSDQQQAFDPEFHLTVGIASQSRLVGACIEPGTSVKVSYSYARLPLASGLAPEMCVGPNQSSEERRAIARGFGVTVPGYLMNNLVKDMDRGHAVFEVTMKSLKDDHWTVVTCWPRVAVPGSAAGFKAPCTRHLHHISRMPDTEPADVGYVRRPAMPQGDMGPTTAIVAGSCPSTTH